MESIDPRHLLIKVAKILESLDISYLVTGGMAVFVWGRPRFTADIDIVVKMKLENVNQLADELMALSEASFIDKETIERSLIHSGEFNFIDGISGIKVDFWVVSDKQFEESQLKRRVLKKILGKNVYFISPEDLILSKLIWYNKSQSARQLEDIESVLKIQKKLDLRYIKKWAKEQSTIKIFNGLLTKIKNEKN